MNNQISQEKLKEHLKSGLIHDLPVLRARLGVSQEELADMIGISRQTYNAIETGKKDMNWLVFLSLVTVFQNNEETRVMINMIDGFEEELLSVIKTSI